MDHQQLSKQRPLRLYCLCRFEGSAVCSVLREMPPCTSRGLVMRPTRDFILPSSLLGPHSQPLGGKKKKKGVNKKAFFPILDFYIVVYVWIQGQRKQAAILISIGGANIISNYPPWVYLSQYVYRGSSYKVSSARDIIKSGKLRLVSFFPFYHNARYSSIRRGSLFLFWAHFFLLLDPAYWV